METLEENEARWNEYLIPGTEVLKNKLNITNQTELEQKEIDISFIKLLELQQMPIDGNFDASHLCAIHKYIFDDIYYFAGKYRTANMSKGSGMFTTIQNIEDYLNSLLLDMKKDFNNCSGPGEFAFLIANYMYDLFQIHPFREGNGRSVREFLREFTEKYLPGYTIDWSKINKENYNRAFLYPYIGKSLLQIEIAKSVIFKENLNKESTELENIL